MTTRFRLFAAAFLLTESIAAAPAVVRADAPNTHTIALEGTVRDASIEEANDAAPRPARVDPALRGWDRLVERLIADGHSADLVRGIYSDRRMPEFSEIQFSVRPKEAQRPYDAFLDRKRLSIATNFLKENSSLLSRAEKKFGVDRHLIVAILYIETQCGKFTGTHAVINRLSRLAAIAEPNNVLANYERLKKDDPTVTLKDVQDRAEVLEKLFYPEIPALLEIAKRHGYDVFGIRGSVAGAFGLPQFLPSTYLKFAVDGNQDGRISLHQKADAVYSAANYLAQSGWRNDLSPEEQRKVIWKYNRSEPYVDTVLRIAERLRAGR